MGEKISRKTIVIGHKNPDTDSICSAICYANLKRCVTGENYQPGRAGAVNEETQFVLKHFNVEAPEIIENVKTQVRDIEIRETAGVKKNLSLKKAWNIMQEANVVTIPAVTEEGLLEGLITVGDIAKSYMNVYDSSILSKANTQYANIVETLEGAMIVGDETSYFSEGKVLIAAANPDMMEYYISRGDLVILGNRYESQLCAIEMDAACIIVCEGAAVSMTIKKLAQEHGCTVMTTPYDTFTAARLVNQSMPIKYFMKKENFVTFDIDDYVDEVREVMSKKRHRDFPVLDDQRRYLGMVSRRNLLNMHKKKLILVDHNEKSQAIDGIEGAEILEIIDHHRLGSLETTGPVFFRNQPLGCTSTIVYQMYCESGIEIEEKIAGLLLSAILSDTLMFRSPTCTKADHEAARALAAIAKVDIVDLADRMFRAGCDFASKTVDEIFYQDFKTFHAGDTAFGVAQISAVSREELSGLKEKIHDYMNQVMSDKKVDMVFVMLTDILNESTELLCCGKDAVELATGAYHLPADDYSLMLPGVVSRKKQLIPSLITAMQQEDQ